MEFEERLRGFLGFSDSGPFGQSGVRLYMLKSMVAFIASPTQKPYEIETLDPLFRPREDPASFFNPEGGHYVGCLRPARLPGAAAEHLGLLPDLLRASGRAFEDLSTLIVVLRACSLLSRFTLATAYRRKVRNVQDQPGHDQH